MKLIDDTFKGFLFGLGFSVAAALIFFIYFSKLQAAAEFGYSKNLKNLYHEEASEAASRISPEIISHKALNGSVLIITEVENSYLGRLGYYLKFKLLDSQGNAEICTQPIHPEYGNNGNGIYQTKCSLLTLNASKVEKVSVSIGLGKT